VFFYFYLFGRRFQDMKGFFWGDEDEAKVAQEFLIEVFSGGF